jgi:pyrimidine operon attenuation protein/uracil phosphoribosyltransferase
MSEKKYIMDTVAASQKINRMALEIAEQVDESKAPLILIGIEENGCVIADAVANELNKHLFMEVVVHRIGINKQQPQEVTLRQKYDYHGKQLVLVDDVTNSGKTLLYALKPLMNYYPAKIMTLVLVERMYKRFPVQPDFVGLSLATTEEDHIQVEVSGNQIIGAYIE